MIRLLTLTLLPALFLLPGVSPLQAQITGRVVDAQSGDPIEFATVLLTDSVSTAPTGTTTDLEGRFQLSKNYVSDSYLEISFIGMQTRRVDLPAPTSGPVDLGDVQLNAQGQTLDEITVRAEKSSTEFRLDKRVFNVGQDLSSTGAGALEVLNNVPSVNVTIEGQVQLRGAGGVQILIDGKPSIIAADQGNLLGTITADMIESVEVITNPSAKYDAEGTSGIINIVLKKEEKRGLNGALSVNTGVPDNHSVGLSLNRRTEKFNLFSQLGVGYRELPEDERTENLNRRTGVRVLSQGREFRNELFYNAVLGTDYHLDEYNVFTLSANVAYEVEDQPSSYDFERFDIDGSLLSRWRRDEVTEATNPKYQFEFQYVREFKDDEDHQLIFSTLGSLFQKDQSSEFTNTTLEGADNDGRQRTATNFGTQTTTVKLDYTRPLGELGELETGGQFLRDDVGNDFTVSNFDGTVFVTDPALTNVFNWDQRVSAAYATYGREVGKFGFKGGLRLENTRVETLLETTNEANDQNYTNLFPSGHVSYKLNDEISFQAGYSRRIFRPRMWDLNPFFNPRNEFNIYAGNPDLGPEFTDSYEVSGVFVLGALSFNASVYHRYTTDVVERITRFDGNVALTTPDNVGTDRSTGLELNGKWVAGERLTLTGDLNYFRFARAGELEGQDFDFSADQYSGRLMGKLDLPADIDLEITGRYRSAFRTVQARVREQLFFDLGLRKRLFKGRGSINASVRDIFVGRIRESVIDNPEVFQFRSSFRGRFVTLGLSYGFGKGETMEYLGQRRRI